VDRELFQTWISTANPLWKEFFDEMVRTSTQPRTNPDGDVGRATRLVPFVLDNIQVAIEHLGVYYEDFVVPYCPSCLAENRRNNVVRTVFHVLIHEPSIYIDPA